MPVNNSRDTNSKPPSWSHRPGTRSATLRGGEGQRTPPDDDWRPATDGWPSPNARPHKLIMIARPKIEGRHSTSPPRSASMLAVDFLNVSDVPTYEKSPPPRIARSLCCLEHTGSANTRQAGDPLRRGKSACSSMKPSKRASTQLRAGNVPFACLHTLHLEHQYPRAAWNDVNLAHYPCLPICFFRTPVIVFRVPSDRSKAALGSVLWGSNDSGAGTFPLDQGTTDGPDTTASP